MTSSWRTVQIPSVKMIVPLFSAQTGDPKDVVRNLVRDIFDAIGAVYPISKLFNFIMEGVKSKNARQRTGMSIHPPMLSTSVHLSCTDRIRFLRRLFGATQQTD